MGLGWIDETPEPRNVGGRPAVDKRRSRGNRRMVCSSCGFSCRSSAAAIKRAGALPVCGCGTRLELPDLLDRAAVEPETVEEEINAAAERAAADAPPARRDATYRRTYNAAAAEIGWPSWGSPAARWGSSGETARCQWAGGHCVKFVSGLYCPEHDPHEIARRSRRPAA